MKVPLVHITGKFYKCLTVNGLFYRLIKRVWLSVCPQGQAGCFRMTLPTTEAGRRRQCVEDDGNAIAPRPGRGRSVLQSVS